MAIYTVHLPPGEGISIDRASRTRFVREGFSVAALLVPPLWILWHRLWIVLIGWIAAMVAIEAAGRFVDETAAGLVGLAFAFWFALVARDLQRWTLDRNGYGLAAVVEGRDREAAERRFFEEWLTTPRPAAPSPVAARRFSTPPPAGPIGLFPAAGGREA